MTHTRISRRRRFQLRLEELENRIVPAGIQPTDLEQLLLERLNEIRANPVAYGQSINLDLSSVAASQPLAFDTRINQAARGHSLDMSNANFFGHTSSTGLNVGQRLSAAGYPWTGYGESIAAGFATPEAALEGLIVDAGIPSLGHRRQLLAIDAHFKDLNEVGVGIITGGSGQHVNYFTIDTAKTSDSRPILTGSVFKDANNNGKYDLGEGIGNLNMTVHGIGTITTFASGGYSFQLSPGTYTVDFSGGSLASTITQTVTVGTMNQRLSILVPDSPVMTAPGDATDDATPTFAWQPFDGAVRYEIWVNDASGNRVVHDTNVTGTSFTPSQSLALGNHIAWVRAYDSAGEASQWSTPNYFSVNLLLNAETNVLTPSGSVNNPTPIFTWQAMNGAERYEFWVNDASGNRVLHDTSLTGTSFTPDSGLAADDYIVWVRGIDSAGQTSKWSPPVYFTVESQDIGSTTFLSPSAGVVGDATPTFTWTEASNAVRYELWINDSYGNRVLHDTNIFGTSYTAGTALTPGSHIGWVRAYDSAGIAGEWTAPLYFSIEELPLGIPELQSPGDVTDDATPTFAWTESDSAARYEIWVNNASGDRVVHDINVAATNYTAATALASGAHIAWVRAYDNVGEAGGWSAPFHFAINTLLNVSPVLTTGGDDSGELPTFTWDAITGAVRYELWVNDASGERVLHNTEITGTALTPTSALGPGDHIAWVRAYDSAGQASQWSAPVEFTVIEFAERTPLLLAPNGSDNGVTPTFTWQALAGAEHYELWVNNAAGERVLYDSNVSGTAYTPSTWFAAGDYRFWVRAHDSEGTAGKWSEPTEFSVAPAEVGVATPLSPTGNINDGTPTFEWNEATGATWYRVFVYNYNTGEVEIDTWIEGLTSYTPSENLDTATYGFWVQTWAYGVYGQWSEGLIFTV